MASVVHVRSVAALVLLLLLCLQPQPVASVEIDDDCVHLLVTPPGVPESVAERLEHYRAIEAKDLLRHRQISKNVTGRRQARESSKLPEVMSDTSMFELPMRSAINIAHVGMYLVSVRFGTPALPYSLALDTATDLTWINCRLRRRGGKHHGRPPRRSPTISVLSLGGESAPLKVIKNWYRPARSSSWRRIRCSHNDCAELPHNTCESDNQTASCSYWQQLMDGTITSGIYGKEKATVALSGGRMAKLPGLILGCSTFESGGSVDSHDGVLALGNSLISFGVHAARRFSGRFSFCLLNTNSSRDVSSYLTFGNNPHVNASPATMQTPIKYHPDMQVAYGFHVTAVFVGDQLLDIPPEVWDDTIVGGGMVLDTGTSLTALTPPAYRAVTKALDRHLAHLQPVTEIPGFEFCYSWTFTGDGVDPAHNVTIPKFTVEMQGGARLEPDAKSVVMPEVVPGVACLGFREVDRGPGIMGNILMQEHIWEIDHTGERIRFRKDKCTEHSLSNHNN